MFFFYFLVFFCQVCTLKINKIQLGDDWYDFLYVYSENLKMLAIKKKLRH